MPDDVKDKIAELEKELYAKDFKTHRVEDTLTRKEVAPAPAWDPELDEKLFLENEARRHRIMKKFVKFSIGFFAIAVAITTFIWWRGSNIVSGENIAINILAPLAISGGEPFETKFTITNNNKVPVDAATLLIEYPAGFYSAADSAELPRVSKELGSIPPGQSVSESVNTFLYGEDNTNKEPTVILEYRMAGSNAILKKTTTYAVKTLSSPVNVNLKIPNEISSGQEVDISIEIGSNSKDPMGNLVVEATYPYGFSFESSDPAPSYNTNSWSIPSLSPKEKRTIKIRGIIEGQENEERVTRISVGTQSAKDKRLIGVVYNTTTELSTITKPVLGIDFAVNNNRDKESVASLGKGVKVEVLWKNNNPTKVSDLVIEVKLKGGVLDRYSIYASGGGYYRSIDNTIVWDKAGDRGLASVLPGANGVVSFSFSPVALGGDASRLVKNPQIIFDVRASARRISETGAPDDTNTFATRSVKFETDLRLGAKGLFFTGPFQNTGPIPPQADNETTYTITLTARNLSNNVSSALVKTTLPVYVKWLGKVYPADEDIMYNESTNEVSWSVGRIPAGGSREASFQISLLPSVTHIGKSPLLTGDITIVATDDFTKTEVRDKKPAISTHISADPQFSPNDANVVN